MVCWNVGAVDTQPTTHSIREHITKTKTPNWCPVCPINAEQEESGVVPNIFDRCRCRWRAPCCTGAFCFKTRFSWCTPPATPLRARRQCASNTQSNTQSSRLTQYSAILGTSLSVCASFLLATEKLHRLSRTCALLVFSFVVSSKKQLIE